ncbi:MAG: polysaccharide pyruvyl transferase family protein [Verrucomicrobiota bacterium]
MHEGEISKNTQSNSLDRMVSQARGRRHHRPGMDWVQPLEEVNRVTTPTEEGILVGPSDQYSVGDLLRPHVLTRVLNLGKFRCSSLVSSDMTPFGGHSVRNYGESALEMVGSRLQLIHLAGNRIDTDLVSGYSAAAEGEEAERFDSLAMIGGAEELATYVRRRSGQTGDLAYVLSADGEFYGASLSFHSVGLSDPSKLSEKGKEDLLRTMRQANFIGVRDENGAKYLEAEGFSVRKMPCPLTVLPQVCARQLREHRDCDALEELRRRFPNGWIAVEISGIETEYEERLTSALREVSERENLGLVFFEAVTDSPGHRTVRLQSWVNRFPEWIAAGFESADIWDVASMLLHSRLYCGSDLDCRIICMSGGIARINIPMAGDDALSYCELWEHDEVPIQFSNEEEWIVAFDEALSVDLSLLQQHSLFLHREYMEALAEFCEATGVYQRLTSAASETTHERVHAKMHHLHDEWLSDEESLKRFKRLNRRVSTKRLRRAVGRKLGQAGSVS